ncbi:hypothetical protein MYMAC_003975 [Corallococcus macrosporus DSM 14697]|uniref:Uncharacterized protein n=1 Tax=Corallococcus macrosporus DSM 14697 TaxID=1189310 RepID=A0A250JWV4_9BACT|nr:hypothetical protein MYMAC_003975 [Corallococcus macrosporus DSM 14697]
MRKGIQKWVFVVGVVFGGMLGTVRPAEAQASIDRCPDQCADASCTCVYRCYSMGSSCLCEQFPVCF